MSGSGSHGSQTTLDGIHINHQWEFADKTAREATTNPKTNAPYVASEIYKYAIQLDNLSVWMLTGTTPTWVGVSVNSVVSGLTAGRVVYVDTDGSLADDSTLTFDITEKILGFNTTSNDGKSAFVVGQTGTGRAVYCYRSNSAPTRSLFSITESTAGGTQSLLELYSASLGNLIYATNSAGAKFVVNSSGQVLIGTTTATTGAQLDVAGDIVVSDGAGGAKITLNSTTERIVKPSSGVFMSQKFTAGGVSDSGGALLLTTAPATLVAATTTDVDLGINADDFNSNNRGLWVFEIIGVGEYSNSPHGFTSVVMLKTDGTVASTGTSLSFVSDSASYLSACTVVSDASKNLFLQITNSNATNDVSSFIANVRLVESRW